MDTLPKRRSVRLPNYDYASVGYYFVTICAYNHEHLFGEIVGANGCSPGVNASHDSGGNAMALNDFGRIVQDEWIKSQTIRDEIELDEFIVMPNHIHGIVVIKRATDMLTRASGRSPLPMHVRTNMGSKTLSSFVAGFKSAVTLRVNQFRGAPRMPVWQRNYYEHIIRCDKELNNVRKYIVNNPSQWADDNENIK